MIDIGNSSAIINISRIDSEIQGVHNIILTQVLWHNKIKACHDIWNNK